MFFLSHVFGGRGGVPGFRVRDFDGTKGLGCWFEV